MVVITIRGKFAAGKTSVGCKPQERQAREPPKNTGSSGAAPWSDYPGDDLLSHTVTHAVPSALKGLTSVFGKGTGVSPSP